MNENSSLIHIQETISIDQWVKNILHLLPASSEQQLSNQKNSIHNFPVFCTVIIHAGVIKILNLVYT